MLDDFQKEQPITYNIMKNSLIKNHLVHAYLIETNGYSKSLDLGISFAKYLLCPNKYSNHNNCGNCTQCKIIDDNNYPDIKIIKPEGQWIKKEQLDELQKNFSTKSTLGSKKIYIITDASKLNNIAANSILKFLEEPSENIIALLFVDNVYQLLDTIVSRCQIINLRKNAIDLNIPNIMKLKIANILFNNEEAVRNFYEDNKTDEMIDKIVDFISYYEKNGIKTLCHTNRLFFEYFNDKELYGQVFEMMLIYYKDILNCKLKKEVNIFEKYIEKIKSQADNNEIIDLCRKIDIIIQMKEKVKINANANLLIDKLIISLEEGKMC